MDKATRMTATLSSEEMARLRGLVPLHTLPEDAFDELIEGSAFETVVKGKMLFQQGDTDNENVYLLKGSVALFSGKTVVERVNTGSDTARFPLAHQLPRQYSVRAESKTRIARIDSRRLSDLLARTQKVDYQVADFDAAADDDWMSMLLQSPVLQQVPPANLQQVIMNVEQVELASGEDLIRQGDPGDFYYMLTKGRAVVRRDNGDGKGPCELATLGPGDAFGEEALLSDSPRNSSVTMLQDGEVLRLGKDHFVQLIHNPLLDRIDMPAAQSKVEEGAIWLDLRTSDQYDESHLPGAINYPFESLRYQASSLAPDRHYVLYSNAGGRAMAGAFMLTERGFQVSVLQGGVQQAQSAPVPPDEDDDAAAQERIREAEARAVALEERLKELQREQENATAEREQHLQQVRESVDQARHKLIETEEQRREALAAQQKAYVEMEQLTSSLEQLQSERSSLVDRMCEIEGLDKQLQTRLAKAERELIGERERAESATSSLEELSDRLSEIIEKREEEREQHARERGELKEEVTALQVELEQGRLDIGELREKLAQRLAAASAEDAASSELQRRLAEAEEARQAMQLEIRSLQSEVGALGGQLEQQAAEHAQQQTEWQERLASLGGELEAARGARDAQQLSAAEELASARAATDDLRAELESALSEAQRAAEERMAALGGELGQVRAENEALKSELVSGSEEAGAALAQAQDRVAELEQQLAADTGLARERLHAKEAELESVMAQLQAVVSDHETDKTALESVRIEHADLQQRLADTERAHAALQTELAGLQDETTAIESRLGEEKQQLAESLKQEQERAAELEGQLAGQAASAQQSMEEIQSRLDKAEVEKVEAELRVVEIEQRLNDEAGGAFRQISEKEAELEATLALLAGERDEKAQLAQALESAQAERQQTQTALAEARQEAAEKEGLAAELEAQLAAGSREADERVEAARAELEQLRAELDNQRADKDSLAAQLAGVQSGTEDELSQLRAEIAELNERLERRETALTTARGEQAELIQALNAASAERESLLMAMSDREQDQARLVDLENQVAEALRSHQSDLLAKEQEQQRLREQLIAEDRRSGALQEEVDRLNALLDTMDEDHSVSDSQLRAEKGSLRAELAQRESEVEQLRGVLKEYVDQIEAAQSADDDGSEVSALRAELEMVREQAIHDVAQMREQLAAAETQKRRMQQADGREAISHEAMRQRIEELESSLAERQRLLAEADESRHMLEDSMEDVNQKLDDLSRELEKAQTETGEALRDRREAETAREQLQEALRRLQEDAEESKVTDLRDDRFKSSRRPIGIDNVAAPSRWLPGMVGAGLAIGLLEAVSIFSGRGELVSALLRLSGQ
jgi:CRP-like cAMP-binding protein/chromosome segregation ATPase